MFIKDPQSSKSYLNYYCIKSLLQVNCTAYEEETIFHNNTSRRRCFHEIIPLHQMQWGGLLTPIHTMPNIIEECQWQICKGTAVARGIVGLKPSGLCIPKTLLPCHACWWADHPLKSTATCFSSDMSTAVHKGFSFSTLSSALYAFPFLLMETIPMDAGITLWFWFPFLKLLVKVRIFHVSIVYLFIFCKEIIQALCSFFYSPSFLVFEFYYFTAHSRH